MTGSTTHTIIAFTLRPYTDTKSRKTIVRNTIVNLSVIDWNTLTAVLLCGWVSRGWIKRCDIFSCNKCDKEKSLKLQKRNWWRRFRPLIPAKDETGWNMWRELSFYTLHNNTGSIWATNMTVCSFMVVTCYDATVTA